MSLTGSGEIGQDTELDPPDGEAGETAERHGSERGAVVGADALREPELAEETSEDASGVGIGGAIETLAGEQIPTEAVLDGERVAVAAIEGLELTFEVGGPDGVGCIEGSGGSAGMRASATPARLLHEAIAPEVLVEDPSRRDAPVGVQGEEPSADLVGTPTWSARAELEGRLKHMWLGGMWMSRGTAGTVPEAIGSFGLVAVEPLVARLAADAVAQAELRVREKAARGLEDESLAFVPEPVNDNGTLYGIN